MFILHMKIPKYIIDMYRVHFHIYLDFMEKSATVNQMENENEIVYYGWKMLLQIMSIMYVLNRSNKDVNTSLQEGYMLYLEYIERIYSKNIMTQLSPSIFVLKTVIGQLRLDDPSATNKNNEETIDPLLFTRITKWTNVISLWDCEFTTSDRQILNVAFLTNYLERLASERYDTYQIIENIQEIWKKNKAYVNYHVVLLDKFYKRTIASPILTKTQVETICLEKFIEKREYTTNLINNIQYNHDVDVLLSWILT